MTNTLMSAFIFIALLIMDFLVAYLTDPSDLTLRSESYEVRKRKRFWGLVLFWSVIIGILVYYGIKSI